MAQQTINTTDSPETGRGKINDNFTEVYARTQIPSQTGNAGKFLKTNGSAVSWANTTDVTPITIFFYKANPVDGDFLGIGGIPSLTAYTTRSTYTMARINGSFSNGTVYSEFQSVVALGNGFVFSVRADMNQGQDSDQNTLSFYNNGSNIFSTSILTDVGSQTYAWCTVELY